MRHPRRTLVLGLTVLAVLAFTPIRNPLGAEDPDPRDAVRKEALSVVGRLVQPAVVPLAEGKAWIVELIASVDSQDCQLLVAWDGAGRQVLKLDAPGLASVQACWSPSKAWLFVPEHSVIFNALPASPVTGSPLESSRLWGVVKSQLAAALLTARFAALPENLTLERTTAGVFRAGSRDEEWQVELSGDAAEGPIRVQLSGPAAVDVTLKSARSVDAKELESLLAPPGGGRQEKVSYDHLRAMLPAAIDLLCEKLLAQVRPELLPSLPADIPRVDGRAVLVLRGTPEEIGREYGLRLKDTVTSNVHRILHGIGLAETIRSGKWFPDTLAAAWKDQEKYLPRRYVREMDAIAAATGLSRDDVRHTNLFPELFHCSGVAVRGDATAGGQLLHARILDYMTEVGLQNSALCTVVAPKGRHAWINVGYAGCIGTVTGMNIQGLAMGEMGGRGEGHLDGMPMTFLMREVLERFETTDEALAWIRSVPRTCEYFYVLSDAKTRSMAGIASYARSLAREKGIEDLLVIRPGDSHPLLPHGIPDAVLMSAGGRYERLVERVRENYGKITPEIFWGILGEGVAMRSALHIAVFLPETLDLWVAEASVRSEPAYTQPISKLNLRSLLEDHLAPTTAGAGGF